MSGLYSLEEGRWWGDALKACGIRENQLPRLVDIAGVVGAEKICEKLAMSDELEIVFAGNDQTAGAYANHCDAGRFIVTLGTALVAYRYAGGEAGPYSSGGCWGPYPDGGYYELGFTNYGCSALDWAREVLAPDCDVEQFSALVESAVVDCDSGSSFFYPDRMGGSEAWVGDGGQGEKALAVLEGISFSLRELIDSELGGSESVSVIEVGGGGSKSRLWRQLLADILDCSASRTEKDSLLGAAMMALPGAGGVEQIEVEQLKADADSVKRYERLYQQWLRGKGSC